MLNPLSAEAVRPPATPAAVTGVANPRPPLLRDRSFWGMTVTQFLGAFNDNLFKQVVLLLCIDFTRARGGPVDLQALASGLFALPFVLFSGFAGFLSDRYSKRRIVVTCKMAEICVVLLGTWALSSRSLPAILAVLFLLGTHSAFFGPPKFGILPEIATERDLPVANGLFLMTTFLAIIFGIVLAGKLKFYVDHDGMTTVAAAYISVALCGLLSSLLVRKTPAARPGLPFAWSDLAVSGETVRMFWRDRPLLVGLIMYSVFWLIGGITLPAINAFGKLQLFRDLPLKDADELSSQLSGFLTIGIAVGCVGAGWLARNKNDFRYVPWGGWGMVAGLSLVALLGWLGTSQAGEAARLPMSIVAAGARVLLGLMGVCVGVFTVPLQVFLQSRPPADQKGRVIGAMNLVNWIGILLAAGIYSGFDWIRKTADAPPSAIFAATALLLLPVALFYRPKETPRPEPLP